MNLLRREILSLVLALSVILHTLPMIMGTISLVGTRKAEAQEAEEILIERGYTSETYRLGNTGLYRAVLGLNPWVLDESTGDYVPYLVSQLDGTIDVKTGRIGWKIGPAESGIFDPNLKELRAVERWVLYYNAAPLDLAFQDQILETNSTGVFVTSTYSSTIERSAISAEIVHAVYSGKPTERIVTMTGVPDELAPYVYIEREWSGMTAAEISDETGSESLSADSRTLVHEGLIESVRFTDIAGELIVHENLRTAGDKLKRIEYTDKSAVFRYSGWTDSNIVLVDDTYTNGAPVYGGYVQTTSISGTSCSTTADDSNVISPSLLHRVPDSSTSGACYRSFTEWDISIIPDSRTIRDVVFKFDVDSVTNARNCSYTPLTLQPSDIGTTEQELWDDVGDGTPYLANDATCTTAGNNKSVDLGSAADTDLQNALVSDWWALGSKLHDETRDGSQHLVTIVSDDGFGTPQPTLEVTYSSVFSRSPSDSFTVSDSIAVTLTAARSATDSKDFSETIAREYAAFRSLAETATMNDSASRKLLGSRSISDYKTFNDSVSYSVHRQATVGDTATVSESIGTALAAPRAASDTVAISDSISYTVHLQTTIGDTITVSDSIGTDLATSRSVSDSTTVSDSLSYTVHRQAAAGDIVTTSESIAIQLHAARGPSDFPTISDSLSAVYTEAVEQPITLNAGSGSPTFQAQGVSATITCEYGGTHDGDPAQQIVQCLEGETVLVSLPSGSSTERWIWEDGTTSDKSFAACETGTCSDQAFTYYLQEKQIVTLQGIDAGDSMSVTRTSGGSTGTVSVSGSTQTDVWANFNTSFIIPDSLDIVTDESRYKSYNSTSYLSYTVDASYTKTPVYQVEYNTLFRVYEEHLGFIFEPMPPAIFMGTIITANGTSIELTFDTQLEDDITQPSTGRVWVAEGVTYWDNITWEGLIVQSSGNWTVNAYGNYDLTADSKHYGFANGQYNQHFRIATNNGTINEAETVYDAFEGTLTFETTATGTQDVKVEFLTNLYSTASVVQVNGTTLESSQWTVEESVFANTAVLVINDLSFSTNTIYVKFLGSGSGGSGTTGGGGGGGFTLPGGISVGVPLPEIPSSPGPSTGLDVFVPPITLEPGQSDVKYITVSWNGATAMIITDIRFSKNPSYFTVQEALPITAVMSEDGKLERQILVLISVPSEERGLTLDDSVQVTARAGESVSYASRPVNIVLAPSTNVMMIYAMVLFAFIGIGIVIVRIRRSG